MKVILFSILMAFFLLVPELYAETNNRVVARVNDDLITLYELNSKIEEKTGKTCEELESTNEEEFFKFRKAMLDQMVIDKLAWEKVKELELLPSKEQIDSYIENIKEDNNWTQEDLIAWLEKKGMTFDKLRKQLMEPLGVRNLIEIEIKDKTLISEDQIADYYESNRKEFEKPGAVHIASILLAPGASGSENQTDELQRKGKDILARLKKGESFADLAREFSNGPGAEEGGDLGNILLTDVHPEIMEVINSLNEGEVSSLIDMGNSFQIIRLIKRYETERVPLEKVKGDIAEKLYNKEMEKRYDEYMAKLKKDSYIKIIL